MSEDYRQKIAHIQKAIDQALEQLRYRERDGLTRKQVKALHRKIARLKEDLEDAEFKAPQERIFRKRYFVTRA